MTLKQFAEAELDIAGITESADPAMRESILTVIDAFSRGGHSGGSASVVIPMIAKLLEYQPLTALTGADSEWTQVADDLYQNRRCHSVFKNSEGEAWNIDAQVFWEWVTVTDADGAHTFKSFYTSFDSRLPVSFPYTPSTMYVERPHTDG